MLRALGVGARTRAEAKEAVRAREAADRSRVLPPVVVLWEGRRAEVPVRLPDGLNPADLRGEIFLEDGLRRDWPVRSAARKLRLPGGIPPGYHRMELRAGQKEWSALLICAPERCYQPEGEGRREWGFFLPLHALRCGHGWPAADFSDLGNLLRWAGRRGAGVVGTLPLLPTYLDRPFDPSPYAPVSRLLWGEFWVDAARAPEMARCPEAAALVRSPAFAREMERLGRGDWVDYRAVMALKRKVVEKLAKRLSPERRARLGRFLEETPEVEGYAKFRAARERSEGAAAYYRYAQWLACRQMEALSRTSGRNAGLYLDLPLGVHPQGYDAWRYRELFASQASTGAPADPLARAGQDWGFHPLHPERIRAQGYRYLIESFRHSMRPARWLRIDHVMGLHRLFWVPQGFSAAQGTYVRYPAEELYAVLSLESHRQRCGVVGEDLGTVPQEVRASMRRHGLLRMFVAQFEIRPGDRRLRKRPPADSLACLNTHDMPTFAAFWGRADAAEAYRRLLRSLAESAARILLVNLEDLWGETRPQNVPGVSRYPNWRRRARLKVPGRPDPFEKVPGRPDPFAALEEIAQMRKNRRR